MFQAQSSPLQPHSIHNIVFTQYFQVFKFFPSLQFVQLSNQDGRPPIGKLIWDQFSAYSSVVSLKGRSVHSTHISSDTIYSKIASKLKLQYKYISPVTQQWMNIDSWKYQIVGRPVSSSFIHSHHLHITIVNILATQEADCWVATLF